MVDESGDGGWCDLFGDGKLSKCERSAKDDDRQCGKPGRGEVGLVVCTSQSAQQVNRGRMKPVSEFQRFVVLS